MEKIVKENVSTFNQDVTDNGGYRYTENASFSSIVSNLRLTNETDRMIRLVPGKVESIIDVGCGDGVYTAEIKQRFPNVEITGFDPADVAISNASRKFSSCKFLVGNILDPQSFPKQKYDLAIIRGVIHHLPTQVEAIKNAMLLSDNILIIEPNGNNPILKWIEKNSKYHIEHQEQSFTSRFFVEACRSLGLKIRHLGFVGFVPFFFPEIPSRIIYFFQPLLEKIPFLAKFFGGQIIILASKN